MAIVGLALKQKWAADAATARNAQAMKKDYGAYAAVGEIWTKQSAKAAHFKTHGWIAHVLLRWQRADGSMVPFDSGYQGDTLMAPVWKLNKEASS